MVKTPGTRVLDLSYGWYEFVEGEQARKEEPITDDKLLAQELFDLYQASGVKAFEEPEVGRLSPSADAEIGAFVNEKILPLLLRR